MNTDTTTAPAAAAAAAPTTAAPAVGKAARERAVKDRDAARLIEAKKAEEKAAREASRKAGKTPDTDTTASGETAPKEAFPGFVSRPTTAEKRKLDWRKDAPALWAFGRALPSDMGSYKEQVSAGKFDPTARRLRIDVGKVEAYARTLPAGTPAREALFYIVQTVRRVGEQNDMRRSDIRSATITLYAGSTSTAASTKAFQPYA